MWQRYTEVEYAKAVSIGVDYMWNMVKNNKKSRHRHYDIKGYTSRGGRDINEDAFLIERDVFVVCDGLGGHEKGDVASRCAVETVRSHMREKRDEDWLNCTISEANANVHSLSSQSYTTIALAFISRDRFYYENVGDSRIYYFRNSRIIAQSRDDSVCQAQVDMGELKPEEIRGNKNRSSLLKVLGSRPGLEIKLRYQALNIAEGDAFLMCSDGFWEYVLEEEMEKDLINSSGSAEWIKRMLHRHSKRTGKGDDNYTVICGRL